MKPKADTDREYRDRCKSDIAHRYCANCQKKLRYDCKRETCKKCDRESGEYQKRMYLQRKLKAAMTNHQQNIATKITQQSLCSTCKHRDLCDGTPIQNAWRSLNQTCSKWVKWNE